MPDQNQIVADGHERAREANEPAIRTAVKQKYAEQLQTAPFWKRWLVRHQMLREIQRRLNEAAPPDAFY